MKNEQFGPIRETMQQAGLKYIRALGNGEHELEDIETGKREIWFNNKNHPSYGIIWNNTHLEFARSI